MFTKSTGNKEDRNEKFLAFTGEQNHNKQHTRIQEIRRSWKSGILRFPSKESISRHKAEGKQPHMVPEKRIMPTAAFQNERLHGTQVARKNYPVFCVKKLYYVSSISHDT